MAASLDKKQIGNKEFIGLMAVLMSVTAFTIDAMLPALGVISSDLKFTNINDGQLIITAVFIGMSFGLLLFGPLSDSYGRKKAIYLGIGIFLVGTLISMFSSNLNTMIVGRLLQGFGTSSCRVGTISMIRDKFVGREMGRIVSLIMIFFILVPVVAPSVGQAILMISDWRTIFGFMGALGLFGLVWMQLRQPETLLLEKRLKFELSTIMSGAVETIKNTHATGYTIASGLVMGCFVGYLSTSQQILQVQYDLGDKFSIYFGILAGSIGIASFMNSKLVMKWGMEKLCIISVAVMFFVSIIFSAYCTMLGSNPPLVQYMIYLLITFFCAGILFGNLGSLAIQSLGHIAGVANSVISSLQTLLSVAIGASIGAMYSGSVFPLVYGFLICSLLAFGVIVITSRKPQVQ
jgi:MFS transporter, DHA1 family, multidrug resistance protein